MKLGGISSVLSMGYPRPLMGYPLPYQGEYLLFYVGGGGATSGLGDILSENCTPPVDRHISVKTVPTRHTTYAGGSNASRGERKLSS